MTKALSEAIEEREERAAMVERADDLLTSLVARAKKRGLTHPYLKSYIVARANPFTRARKNLPSYKSAFSRLTRSLEEFDLATIRIGQIAAAAAIAAASAESR